MCQAVGGNTGPNGRTDKNDHFHVRGVMQTNVGDHFRRLIYIALLEDALRKKILSSVK
jgi:hypothetical protein